MTDLDAKASALLETLEVFVKFGMPDEGSVRDMEVLKLRNVARLVAALREEGDRRAAEMRERCASLMTGLLPTMDLHPDQVTYLVESLRGLPLERIAIRILNPVKP